MPSPAKILVLACVLPVLAGYAAPVALSPEMTLVVVDDPRSDKRRRGVPGPGYGTRLDYDKDPALRRFAERIAADHGVKIVREWPIRSLGLHCFVIRSAGADTLKAIAGDARVRWVQAFNEFETQGSDTQKWVKNPFPLLSRGDLPSIARGVEVAIVDTGADTAHPALTNTRVRFRDFVEDGTVGHHERHGTSVLGVVGAESSVAGDWLGLAAGARIRLHRACWEDNLERGRCNTLTLAQALDDLLEDPPDVLNLSLSGPDDRVLQTLVEQLGAAGTVIVAAYDGKRGALERFPRPSASVVYAVADGADPVDEARSVSMTIAAPGQILTLAPRNDYDIALGHSIAAPQVAALLARLIKRRSTATAKVARLRDWIAAHASAD